MSKKIKIFCHSHLIVCTTEIVGKKKMFPTRSFLSGDTFLNSGGGKRQAFAIPIKVQDETKKAVEEAKTVAVKTLPLPGPFLAISEIAKPRLAARGVHIVVHTRYGPKIDETYGAISPFKSPFQTDIVPIPSMWKTDGFDSKYWPSASVDGAGITLKERATKSLDKWYQSSVESMIDSKNSFDHAFDRHCFTIDIDPSFLLLDDGTIFARDTNGNLIVPKSPSPAFDRASESVQQSVKASITAAFDIFQRTSLANMTLNADYKILELGGDGKLAPGKAMLFEHSVLSDAKKLDSIVSFNGFLSSINDFMMGRFQAYDTFAGEEATNSNFQKHIFVEVIGFASAKDWNDSQFDPLFVQSRLHAWNRWVNARRTSLSEMAINKPRPATPAMAGVYMVQQVAMPPLYTIDYESIGSRSIWFDYNLVFSEMQPLCFLPSLTPPPIPYRKNTGFASDSTIWSIEVQKQASNVNLNLSTDFLSVLELTTMPLYVCQRAFASSSANIAVGDNMYFSKNEFEWHAKDGSLKDLGAGSYGSVIRIRWRSFDRINLGSRQINRLQIFKHSHMLLVLLNHQKRVFMKYQYLKQNAGDQIAQAEFAKSQMAIEKIAIVTEHRAGGPKPTKREIQFANLDNSSIQDYDTIIEAVQRSIKQDAGIFDDQPRVLAYDTEASIQVVLKLGKRTYDASYESYLANLLSSAKESLRAVGIVYDPIEHSAYYTTLRTVPSLGVVQDNASLVDALILVGVEAEPLGINMAKTVQLVTFERQAPIPQSQQDSSIIDKVVDFFFGAGNDQPPEPPQWQLTYSFQLLCLGIPSTAGANTNVTLHHPRIGMDFMAPVLGVGSDGPVVFQILALQKNSLTNMLELPNHLGPNTAEQNSFVASKRAGAYYRSRLVEFQDWVKKSVNPLDEFVKAVKQKVANGPAQGSERPLSLYEYVRILLDACRGLIWMHANGIAHNDIKPPNILVSELRRGLISDLGLSRPYGVSNEGRTGTELFYPTGLRNAAFSAIDPVPDEIAFGKMLRLDRTFYSVYVERIPNEKFYTDADMAWYVGCSFNRAMATKLSEHIINRANSGAVDHRDRLALLSASTTIYWDDDTKIPISQAPVSKICATCVLSDLQALSSYLSSNSNDMIAEMVTESLNQVPTERKIFDGTRLLLQHGISKFRMAETALLLMLRAMKSDAMSLWGSDQLLDEMIE